MTIFVVHFGTEPDISTVSVFVNTGVTFPGFDTYLRGFSGLTVGAGGSIFIGAVHPL